MNVNVRVCLCLCFSSVAFFFAALLCFVRKFFINFFLLEKRLLVQPTIVIVFCTFAEYKARKYDLSISKEKQITEKVTFIRAF